MSTTAGSRIDDALLALGAVHSRSAEKSAIGSSPATRTSGLPSTWRIDPASAEAVEAKGEPGYAEDDRLVRPVGHPRCGLHPNHQDGSEERQGMQPLPPVTC